MAIIFNQTRERSELQQRITADLREKQKSLDDDGVSPKYKAAEYSNETSEYLKQTKATSSLAWIWAILVLMAIGTIVLIIIVTS